MTTQSNKGCMGDETESEREHRESWLCSAEVSGQESVPRTRLFCRASFGALAMAPLLAWVQGSWLEDCIFQVFLYWALVLTEAKCKNSL